MSIPAVELAYRFWGSDPPKSLGEVRRAPSIQSKLHKNKNEVEGSAPLTMTSAGKKAKAKTRKVKSSSAITKRFKATASGKLLRRKAFRAHILTKKHPLRKQRLRRISQVHEGQLKTMQACMLVTPKRP